MSLWAWLDLEGRDIAVFMVAGLIGFAVSLMMPRGPAAVYVSMLLPYHIFLAWLVVTSEESGLSMPVLSTIVSHLAFMAVVILLGIGRHIVPYFGIFRYLIAALAIFESRWLFRADTIRPAKRKEPEPVAPAVKIQSTAADEEAWLRYVAQQKPGSRKTGASMRAEYEQWMLARIAARATAAASDSKPAG